MQWCTHIANGVDLVGRCGLLAKLDEEVFDQTDGDGKFVLGRRILTLVSFDLLLKL